MFRTVAIPFVFGLGGIHNKIIERFGFIVFYIQKVSDILGYFHRFLMHMFIQRRVFHHNLLAWINFLPTRKKSFY